MRRILLAAALLVVLSSCGRRWMPNAPFQLDAVVGRTDVTSVCSILVGRARALGYRVISAQPSRGFFRVPAFLDYDVDRYGVIQVSYFSVQVHPDGSVTISASGHHVRDNGAVMHRKLFRELGHFAAEMQQALGGA